MDETWNGKVVALCGGVGGAKLAYGLDRVLSSGSLTLIINTGDDFEHLGLCISPDIDTVMYTLAELDNPVTGWGRVDESWNFMATLAALGGETWFQLGDRDLALHVERTRRLRAGDSLSAVTAAFVGRLGIAARLLPMSDEPVRTLVHTDQGTLDFQRYFVGLHCTPVVRSLTYDRAATAHPQPAILDALAKADLIVICPSNPYLSVAPILALPDIRSALVQSRAPIVAVSPIIGGRAVKGPAAKIMTELGITPTAAAVADHYGTLIDGYVLDESDAADIQRLTIPTLAAPSVMTGREERIALARAVITFGASLHRRRSTA